MWNGTLPRCTRMNNREVLLCGTHAVTRKRCFCEVLGTIVFVSTGGNPKSFCFKTLCSIAKHFFQALPCCFHLGSPILGRHSDEQTICRATSKMIVIMARGHFRLCEWIKAAFQKSLLACLLAFFFPLMYCRRLKVATFCFLLLKSWDSDVGVRDIKSGSWGCVYEKNGLAPCFCPALLKLKSLFLRNLWSFRSNALPWVLKHVPW